MPTLKGLLDAGYNIVAVYTQPDRPAGRGREPRPSPVKQLALKHDLPVFQPETLKDPAAQQQLADLQADLMVVVAYGLILPDAVLATPRLGCINVHASLLPRWRGAAPIQRAILAGDKETGITIMQMDAGLDTGAMLVKAHCPIRDDDTGASLHDRLMQLGADTLVKCLPELAQGVLQPQAQVDADASYADKLTKAEAEIDWRMPASELERCVRAYNAWPVAYTRWHHKGKHENLRIWQAQALADTTDAAPGTVLHSSTEGVDVATGEGVLRITQLQPAGSRVMTVADFINAHSLDGVTLG